MRSAIAVVAAAAAAACIAINIVVGQSSKYGRRIVWDGRSRKRSGNKGALLFFRFSV